LREWESSTALRRDASFAAQAVVSSCRARQLVLARMRPRDPRLAEARPRPSPRRGRDPLPLVHEHPEPRDEEPAPRGKQGTTRPLSAKCERPSVGQGRTCSGRAAAAGMTRTRLPLRSSGFASCGCSRASSEAVARPGAAELRRRSSFCLQAAARLRPLRVLARLPIRRSKSAQCPMKLAAGTSLRRPSASHPGPRPCRAERWSRSPITPRWRRQPYPPRPPTRYRAPP